jgi:hypothetical protein
MHCKWLTSSSASLAPGGGVGDAMAMVGGWNLHRAWHTVTQLEYSLTHMWHSLTWMWRSLT